MKYDVIVVDPPWSIKKITHKTRPKQIEMDYSIMNLDEIKRLPVMSIANDDCWVFLWTIQRYLFDAKDILLDWGFNHLLTMAWEKTYGRSSGMPLYGFRWNAEFILVGYNKKPSLWPKRPLIPAAFSAVNQGHSIKPDKFYELVEPLGKNRIDLFARHKRKGWDVWGNEVESDISFS
jgi:N6-adenosine-specific RNA methylase IME4